MTEKERIAWFYRKSLIGALMGLAGPDGFDPDGDLVEQLNELRALEPDGDFVPVEFAWSDELAPEGLGPDEVDWEC